MTVNIQNLARKSVSANEPVTSIFDSAGNVIATPGCFREHMYYGVTYTGGVITGDSFATMLAPNYFNDAASSFQAKDIITAFSATQVAFMDMEVVSVVNGVVTVFPVSSAKGFDASLVTANITGMFAAPIQILPAPGAGYAYIIKSWYLTKTAGTNAYGGGGAINLYYDNTRTTAAATSIPATVFTTSNASGIGYAGGLAAAGIAGAAIYNSAVYISNAAGGFTNAVADSTATLYVNFDIISL